MSYDWKDIKQAGLGTLTAVLFFYLLRSGQPIIIDPTRGLIIGLIWLYVSGKPFLEKNIESKKHFFGNIITATIVASVLSLTFNMVTYEQLISYQFFGTAAWLGMLLGITAAQFFDRYNITNMYTRWYHRRR